MYPWLPCSLPEEIQKETLPISFAVLDLMDPWLPAAHFDVILNFYFLSRPLWETYRKALKPGGLLFFETYLRETGSQILRIIWIHRNCGLPLMIGKSFIILKLNVLRLPVRAGSRTRWSAQLGGAQT